MRIKEEGKGLRAEARKLDNLNGFLYAGVLLYEPTAAEVFLASLDRPLRAAESAVSVRRLGVSCTRHCCGRRSTARVQALRDRRGESNTDHGGTALCRVGPDVTAVSDYDGTAVPRTLSPSWRSSLPSLAFLVSWGPLALWALRSAVFRVSR